MPDFFYLLIEYPTLIAIPIVFFAALAIWSHSRTAWVATAAWAVYLVYELGMSAGVFCSGDGCIKRSSLYFVYPILAFLSLVALVQAYAHIRDKRRRERRLAISPHSVRKIESGSRQMSTVATAWDAFLRALTETRELRRNSTDATATIGLLRYVRELLDIIEDEIADGSSATVGDNRAVLTQLRGRLDSLEQDVMPTRH